MLPSYSNSVFNQILVCTDFEIIFFKLNSLSTLARFPFDQDLKFCLKKALVPNERITAGKHVCSGYLQTGSYQKV